MKITISKHEGSKAYFKNQNNIEIYFFPNDFGLKSKDLKVGAEFEVKFEKKKVLEITVDGIKYKNTRPINPTQTNQINYNNAAHQNSRGNNNKKGAAPYNHILFHPDGPKAAEHQTFEDFNTFSADKHSGYLDFTWTSLSAIYVGRGDTNFYTCKGIKAIPGSTTRGLLKSIMEIVARANYRQFNNERIYKRNDKYENNDEFRYQGWLNKNGDDYYIMTGWDTENSSPDASNREAWKYDVIKGEYITLGLRNAKFKFKFRKQNKEFKKLLIHRDIIKDYTKDKNRGSTITNILVLCESPEWTILGGHPIWFEIDNNDKVTDFGHVKNYRFFQDDVKSAIPPVYSDFKQNDLAELIFGHENDPKKPQAGRVFVEDALLKGKATFETVLLKILAEPKISYQKNYLQVGEWDNRAEKIVKPYKLYWHTGERFENTWLRKEDFEKCVELEELKTGIEKNIDPENISPKLYKINSLKNRSDATEIAKAVNEKQMQFKAVEVCTSTNAEFSGRLYFENLSDVELGALLFVMELPDKAAHKLGMGKPLGMGSVKMTVDTLVTIDHKTRYGNFFTKDSNAKNLTFETGEQPEKPDFRKKKKEAFEKWIYEKLNYWEENRMKELLTMLTYDTEKIIDQQWADATRYLSIDVKRGEVNQRQNKNEFVFFDGVEKPSDVIKNYKDYTAAKTNPPL